MKAKYLLEVKNLKAKAGQKEVLGGVNLKIKPGAVEAILGPNASGKSSLANVILGNPRYQVTEGKIFFEGKDITNLTPEKRVKLGLSLTWQSPPAIKGVKTKRLLEKIKAGHFVIPEGEELLEREINVGFSGGERKILELIQILALKPKMVIFDEIDSGLDIKKLEKVAGIIKKELVKRNVSILLITHSGDILNYLKVGLVHVMLEGRIICQQKDYKKVLKTIKKYGYEKCKKHALFSSGS